jgi:hypothetical protein
MPGGQQGTAFGVMLGIVYGVGGSWFAYYRCRPILPGDAAGRCPAGAGDASS